jgi:hypothetical protein
VKDNITKKFEVSDMQKGSRNGMFCLVQISNIQVHRDFNFENQVLITACVGILRDKARRGRMEGEREMANASIVKRKKEEGR